MMLGARVSAPDGFLCLEKGKIYNFLHSDGNRNRTRFVLFSDDGSEISASLVTITRIEFEDALENGLLVESGHDEYPPWLEPVHGCSIAYLESLRKPAKESYSQKIDKRWMAISDLVSRYVEILGSDKPDAIINAHAKSYKPQQNAARLRLWFYSYVVFGFDKLALMPPLHRIGGWNREAGKCLRKLGRPSPKGRKAGYPCNAEMKDKILSGFLKFKSAYDSQDKIYAAVLTKEFGCTVSSQCDTRTFTHPQGAPFPSFPQFRYWVRKLVSPKSLERELKGKNRARARSGSLGSFSDDLQNVNLRAEFDGYYISEKLSGVTEGSPVDSFCVVRAACVLSGAVIGIGFSEGKENMEAYRMALFSMAIDKVKFGELFGMNIKPGEWPSIGLAPGIVFDRGPGATYDGEAEIDWLGSVELTPIFSGQSKATVESSHPRDKSSLDQPTYVHSKLNFVLMSRREIFRVLWDNHTSDASGHMDADMMAAGFKPTPHNVWRYFDDRGRNSSVRMTFDNAVRSFLSKHTATIQKDAVYFYGRKYRSQALVDTYIFDRVARGGVVKVVAYALTMCVRHIWIELEGRIFELDFVRTARTTEGSIDISLRDLQEIDEMRRAGLAALRYERPAIQQEYRDRFKKETGEDWDGGQRKLGRPGKGGAALRDTADYNRFRGKAK